jgi:hypothetical protein
MRKPIYVDEKHILSIRALAISKQQTGEDVKASDLFDQALSEFLTREAVKHYGKQCD